MIPTCNSFWKDDSLTSTTESSEEMWSKFLNVPLTVSCVTLHNSKIQEPSFHTCLSMFRVTGSPVSIPECTGQTASHSNKMAYHFIQGKRLLNTSSFVLFQIHEFKDTTHGAVDKHKQVQIQYFVFHYTYTPTHTHQI